ncbi:MAG: rubrerythrin family protein, partial [Treponema sp.]|nr:rubrerythrin family protein [Treponema sp.]
MAEIKNEKMLKTALNLQRQEITEYHIYSRLCALCRDAHNTEILRNMGQAEKGHALFWGEKTGM